MKFNKMFLQRGYGIKLYGDYYIKHPKLEEVVDSENGMENKYLEYLSIFTTDVVDIADILWMENQIWYEKIDNWSFFLQRATVYDKQINLFKYVEGKKQMPFAALPINKDVTDALNFFLDKEYEYAVILAENIEMSTIVAIEKENYKFYYYTDDSFVFSRVSFETMFEFLKKINWIKRKNLVVDGGTKKAKKYILEHEYKNRMDDLKKQRESSVTIDSITSSLIGKGVISYEELWQLPIYMVYNLYYRLMQISAWDNTTSALNAGCLDTKKNPVNWEKINWSRTID